jgi:hypothetical protein
MRLTNDLIVAGFSDGEGVTRQQIELLGVEYPPKSGWKKRLIGTEISQEKYDFFIKLRNSSKKRQKKSAEKQIKQQNLDLF